MRSVLVILILLLPTVIAAQEPGEDLAPVIEPVRETDFDWNQAKKVSLNLNLVGVEDRVARGWRGLSVAPGSLKKGATGKLSYWVFRVKEILNDHVHILETSKGLTFACEGYPTKDLSVGETVVILDYVRSSGEKDIRTLKGEQRHVETIRLLTAPEIIQFEEALKTKGYVVFHLNDGENFLGKWNKTAGTKNVIAIALDAKDNRFLQFEDFRADSAQLLVDQAKKGSTKLPVPAASATDEVKDQVIPKLGIAELYNELNQLGFTMQIDNKKATAGSTIVRWSLDRCKVEVVELDGGASRVTFVVTANAATKGFTDQDREMMALVGSANFDHADRAGNAEWAKEHFDTPGKMQDVKVIVETFAKDTARALVIRHAKESEL